MGFFSQKIKLVVGLAWLVAFGIGVHKTIQQLLKDYRTVKQTEILTRELNAESQQILDATLEIQDRARNMEFLQSLVTLMPQSKSFIRTQRAMADEVENLRYKVGRHIRNDLHVLVDTRANRLYVKKGLTL